MELTSADIEHKTFRTRLKGFDRQEVEIFLHEIAEEIQRLRVKNSDQQKQLQDFGKEIHEHKEREKAIRNVLLNAHKTADQMKANAEKEARLIVAEAELKAEKILQGAQQRLDRLHTDIAEIKRQRLQMEARLRSTIEACQHLLDHNAEDEEDHESSNTVKVVSR